MNATEKISTAVKKMYGENTNWCHHIAAIHLVATRECEPSPERDLLITHVEQMHKQVKRMCDAYDKLRTLTGALEIKNNTKEPTFYVDDNPGEKCKSFCPVLSFSIL